LIIKKVAHINSRKLSFFEAQHEIKKILSAQKSVYYKCQLKKILKKQYKIYMNDLSLTEYIVKIN